MVLELNDEALRASKIKTAWVTSPGAVRFAHLAQGSAVNHLDVPVNQFGEGRFGPAGDIFLQQGPIIHLDSSFTLYFLGAGKRDGKDSQKMEKMG
jgi:hypothetical protein